MKSPWARHRRDGPFYYIENLAYNRIMDNLKTPINPSSLVKEDALTIYSPSWNSYDSYGRKAVELRRGLTSSGLYVNALGDVPPLDQPIQPTLGGILLGYPSGYERYGPFANLGKKLAITAWESSKIPQDWIRPLNSCNRVSVGSNYTKMVLEDSGITIPIDVNPLGVSDSFQYIKRERQGPYTFLAFTDRGSRKGWDITIRAFLKAFGDSLETRLILKSRKGWIPFRPNNVNIDLVEEDFTEYELAKFYGLIDCMVFPSRGEGFGIPPREFAATGGLVLASEYSGLTDGMYLYGIPIRCKEERAWIGDHQFEGQDLGTWGDPDVEHLAGLMLQAFDGRLTTPAMSPEGAEKVRMTWSWPKFSEEIRELWRSL